MSIEEYYQLYIEDVEIQLDSEQLFPYTPSLIRNLEFLDTGKLDTLWFPFFLYFLIIRINETSRHLWNLRYSNDNTIQSVKIR